MEHQNIDHEINALIKRASAEAKSRDFVAAIEILKKAYQQTQYSELFYASGFTKIIPYFQKAGRYDEVETFCVTELVPLVRSEVKRVFSRKVPTMQEWFFFINIAPIYDKLRLCAQREGMSEDEQRFNEEYNIYAQKHAKLRPIAEHEQLRKEYLDFIGIVPTYKDWPCVLKKRYAHFINEV